MASIFRGGNDPAELPAQLLSLSTLRLVTTAPDQAFTHVRAAPIHALSHVLASYIGLLGQHAKSRAELGGRAAVTLADAMGALADIGTTTQEVLDYIEQLKQGVSKLGPERERSHAFAASGELLKNVVHQPKTGVPLTYKTFSSDELAALDAAAETEDDADESSEAESMRPTPEQSAGDSSDSSDDDVVMRPALPPPPRARKMTKRKAAELADEAEAAALREQAIARWRDADCIPAHVPPFLPPLPGLERVDDGQGDAPAQTVIRASTTLLKAGQSWRTAVPFDASDLAKETSPALLPSLHLRTAPPASPKDATSLAAFHELHGAYRAGKPAAGVLQPTNKRRRVANMTATHYLQNQDSLYASTSVEPYRELSRTGGWVSYAYDVLGRQSVYLRDFDGPLIDSVTTPAAVNADTLAPPVGRAPGTMAYVARQISLEQPVLASRLTRMGPPGPLDPSGETRPYLLDEAGTVAAVRLPPHQEPLFFMPGWLWQDRDPHNPALPSLPGAAASLAADTSVPVDVDHFLRSVPEASGYAAREDDTVGAPAMSPPMRPIESRPSPAVDSPVASTGLKLSLKLGRQSPSVAPSLPAGYEDGARSPSAPRAAERAPSPALSAQSGRAGSPFTSRTNGLNNGRDASPSESYGNGRAASPAISTASARAASPLASNSNEPEPPMSPDIAPRASSDNSATSAPAPSMPIKLKFNMSSLRKSVTPIE